MSALMRAGLGIMIATGLALGPIPAEAQIYVDQDATGANNGDTWQDAYTSLQDALNAAEQTTGTDNIYVAEGTYYPDEGQNVAEDDRAASFNVPAGVNIYGRFAGNEDSPSERVLDRGANPTTLSGEIQQDNQDANNAYTVVTLTGGTLDNVRIAHGNANGDREQRRGGGIDATSGRIQNAWIQQNRAEQGGGIYITGDTTLENVLINENQANQASGVLVTRGASNITSATIADDVTIVDNDPTTTADDTQITNSALTGRVNVLTPTQRTVSFDVHEVGEDLYDGGDAPGELDEVQVTVDGQTYTANTTSGTGSVTFPITTLTDKARVTVSDSDYLGTYMLNNTGTETAPDLTITGNARTTFPDEPDHQSNYGANSSNGIANTDIALSDLDSSYEIRVIPTTSPEGYSTTDEYLPHINQGRSKRWTDLGGYQSIDVNILDEGQSQSWKDKAEEAYSAVKSMVPVPMSETSTLSLSELQAKFNDRSGQNITWYQFGSPANNISSDATNTYIEDSFSQASGGSGIGTFKSEAGSGIVGFETINGKEPWDTAYDSTTDTFNRDATCMIRILYSAFSSSFVTD